MITNEMSACVKPIQATCLSKDLNIVQSFA